MRDILHVDLNAFFASVEQVNNEELKGKPVVVGGDMRKRHGIVLTASYEARRYGIKTTMLIKDALKLCPGLIVVPPHFNKYSICSFEVMNILREFSPVVQQFSIDEAWIDVTNSKELFGEPIEIANKIRFAIKKRVGLTCSVGVSYCKVMAKMASDLRKPDATSVITKSDVSKIIWPMPVEELFGVGKRMKNKLNNIGIFTIGDLAAADKDFIHNRYGKFGASLWEYANGIDNSEVTNEEEDVKGIGNSVTTPKDIVSQVEAEQIFMTLSENVGKKLRSSLLKCRTVEITIKTKDFKSITRRRNIKKCTDLTMDIYNEAVKLFKENWDGIMPIRLLGVRVSDLENEDNSMQISFFQDEKLEKRKSIDKCLDNLQEKFGEAVIQRASLLDRFKKE
ncbi:MAG: DNA polymerase IV [Bacillota bacterium]|nr:DNA polymerase IV [Bacillota bacterium]